MIDDSGRLMAVRQNRKHCRAVWQNARTGALFMAYLYDRQPPGPHDFGLQNSGSVRFRRHDEACQASGARRQPTARQDVLRLQGSVGGPVFAEGRIMTAMAERAEGAHEYRPGDETDGHDWLDTLLAEARRLGLTPGEMMSGEGAEEMRGRLG